MTVFSEAHCADIRRRLLSEPRSEDAAVGEHLAVCTACRDYAHDLRAFENRLERALRIEVAPASAKIFELAHRRPGSVAPRWFAFAASLVVAVIAAALWLSWPTPALAHALVEHVVHEPQAFAPSPVAIPQTRVDAVLKEAGVRLNSDSPSVSYANACEFRWHLVPHLVVRMPQGAVTVMILSHDAARAAVNFDEDGYRGMIVPVQGHGSIAVLTRDVPVDLGAVVQLLMRQLIWLPA